MREILYKAKRIDDGEWICGYYAEIGKRKVIIAYPEMFYDESGKEVYGNEIKDVDPKSICQYTGLTDKAGKRFEGDIFQASDGDCIQRYIIVWNEDSLEWSAECVGNPDGTLPLSEFKVGEIEVIGNIFDNPELIGDQP